MRRLLLALLLGVGLTTSACLPRVPAPPKVVQVPPCGSCGTSTCDTEPGLCDPRDTNHDGYVDCEEDPNPDPVTDIPCGFRDGIPVGS